MDKQETAFSFAATGIGSLPFLDPEAACQEILRCCPEMPYWPQLVRRSPLEDMTLQYTEGLPLLLLDPERHAAVVAPEEGAEAALAAFYEKVLAMDVAAFAMGPAYAPGLPCLIRALGARAGGQGGGLVKGQSVGPVTFLAGVKDREGRACLHDEGLVDAFVRGLGMKAVWQVRRLRETGRRPVLFLDEPYLSGFGSAFSPMGREEVLGILRLLISLIKEQEDVAIGIHCCGNTDWDMLLSAGIDIVNFDAFSFMEPFLLYREAIMAFLEKGGHIAWGIVPTSAFMGTETVEDLLDRLTRAMALIEGWGVPPGTLRRGSLLTPACGMGGMDEASTRKAMELLGRLSEACRRRFL